ncbi:WD40-repeat-containing domain protein [Entophlyctis helioformis]|nr:WD40-repeat-containing domain protein [Entophlyctis helioformis]
MRWLQRWVFTGADDGFIRKYDFYATLRGDTLLTQAQRHGLVDTVSGALVSAWENEDKQAEVGITSQHRVSPVYSLDVHSEGVWCVSGLDNGRINLWTVRHDEGSCAHVFEGHTNTVSVLKISGSERSLYSGSWDKTVKLWSLDSGRVTRDFKGVSSQVTSMSLQPSVPTDDAPLLVTSFDGHMYVFDHRDANGLVKKLPNTLGTAPPWALSACWSIEGSKIYCGRRNGVVEEYDFGEGRLLRSIQMPRDSGPVTLVQCMANGRSLLCASKDNIRLWDLDHEAEIAKALGGTGSALNVSAPFVIVPGHHGGMISCLLMDPSRRFMVAASGSRGWDGLSTNFCLLYGVDPVASTGSGSGGAPSGGGGGGGGGGGAPASAGRVGAASTPAASMPVF